MSIRIPTRLLNLLKSAEEKMRVKTVCFGLHAL